MFFDVLYGGFGGYDDGPDRSYWRDKSDAAMRREQDAKNRFDAFFQESKSSTAFPLTQEVVPPQVHLTGACWKTFKQYVSSKGCTTKRREATHEERRQSREHRKGKVYVISVTIPVHPNQIEAAMDKKKKDAEEKRKKELIAIKKKQAEAARKAEEEQKLKAQIKEEYDSIVSDMSSTKSILQEKDANTTSEEPAKKRRKLGVPRDRILQHADKIHQERVREISNQISREEREERTKLLKELSEKKQAEKDRLQKEAKEHCDRIKKHITDMGAAKSE